MIAVSDTGPVHYLLLIQAEWLLSGLFEKILVPPVVLRELQHPSTPNTVRDWIGAPPAWLEVRPPRSPLSHEIADPGEAEAIPLALETGSLLLADDLQAIKLARGMGIVCFGTLGVLQRAHALSLLPIEDSLRALGETNFRYTSALFERVSRRAHEMRSDL